MKSVSTPLISMLVAGLLSLSVNVLGESNRADSWLPTLQTETPEQGFELAVKLSRMGVKTTQPDTDILKQGREQYAKDADALIDASQVIAVHFSTIAAANDYWPDE
ncbi:MAG: hexameric tyrosine-coordinated heme protein [Haliea sp.]